MTRNAGATNPRVSVSARLGAFPARISSAHATGTTRCLAREAEIQTVEEFVLPPITRPEDVDEERKWIATQIMTWLDEEWTPLAVHADVGRAAADAFCALRAEGETDMGSIVLGLSAKLLSFNFRETFTGAFEVANKVVELLMMRGGCDVCCTSASDKERMDRVSTDLLSSGEE